MEPGKNSLIKTPKTHRRSTWPPRNVNSTLEEHLTCPRVEFLKSYDDGNTLKTAILISATPHIRHYRVAHTPVNNNEAAISNSI